MDPYNQESRTLAHLHGAEWCISLKRLVFTLATSSTLLDEINYRSAHFRPKEAFSSSMDCANDAHMQTGLLYRPSRTLGTRVLGITTACLGDFCYHCGNEQEGHCLRKAGPNTPSMCAEWDCSSIQVVGALGNPVPSILWLC